VIYDAIRSDNRSCNNMQATTYTLSDGCFSAVAVFVVPLLLQISPRGGRNDYNRGAAGQCQLGWSCSTRRRCSRATLSTSVVGTDCRHCRATSVDTGQSKRDRHNVADCTLLSAALQGSCNAPVVNSTHYHTHLPSTVISLTIIAMYFVNIEKEHCTARSDNRECLSTSTSALDNHVQFTSNEIYECKTRKVHRVI